MLSFIHYTVFIFKLNCLILFYLQFVVLIWHSAHGNPVDFLSIIGDSINKRLTMTDNCCGMGNYIVQSFMFYCEDGTYRDGFCCATGSCNSFCCGCGGSCRTAKHNWVPGDVVGCKKQNKYLNMSIQDISIRTFYIHTFIYVGGDDIVEVYPNRVGRTSLNSQIRESNMCTVMTPMVQDRMRRYNIDYTTDKFLIVRRAVKMVGKFWDYHLFQHNCQHFVTLILSGNKWGQVALEWDRAGSDFIEDSPSPED